MRPNFYLMTVCGTALAISNPAVALGQNTQQPRETQARQARTTTTQQNADARNPASVLRNLEGLWKIEVRVNEALWNMRNDEGTWSRPDGTDRNSLDRDGLNERDGLERDNRTQRDLDDRTDGQNRDTIDRTGTPTADEPEILKPVGDRPAYQDDANQPADRTTTGRPTTDRTTGRTGDDNMDNLRSVSEVQDTRMVEAKTLHGAAETEIIMGGNILQQRSFLENGLDDTSAGASDRDRRAGSARINASDAMQTLSYISFDEARGTYSAVFMCDEKGMMHFDSGRYDATTNRIVFNGRDAAYGSPSYRGYDSTGTDRDNRDEDGQLRDGYTDRSYPDADRDGRNSDDPNRSNPATNDGDLDREPATTGRDAADSDRSDRDNDAATDRRTAAQRDADRDSSTTQPRSTDSARVTRGPEDKPVYVVAPSHGNDLDNVSVVLELIGDDQYRVTMYQGAAGNWNAGDMESRVNANPNDRDTTNRAAADRDNADRNTADRDNLDRDNSDRDASDRDNSDRDDASRTPAERDAAARDNNTRQPTDSSRAGANDSNMIASNVVYQATFTRATGSEESSYRQMFEDADR